MANDEMRYDQMVEEALRGVVRRAIEVAKSQGLSGDHHFYLTFLSQHPDVEMPVYLREQYPEEMTIVLQHQFYELTVDDEGFSVTLSFNSQRETLRVPFEAITTFADPSVNFALHFQKPSGTSNDRDEEDSGAQSPDTSITALPSAGVAPMKKKPRAPKLVEPTAEVEGEASESAEEGPEKVVILDHFRNKEP